MVLFRTIEKSILIQIFYPTLANLALPPIKGTQDCLPFLTRLLARIPSFWVYRWLSIYVAENGKVWNKKLHFYDQWRWDNAFFFAFFVIMYGEYRCVRKVSTHVGWLFSSIPPPLGLLPSLGILTSSWPVVGPSATVRNHLHHQKGQLLAHLLPTGIVYNLCPCLAIDIKKSLHKLSFDRTMRPCIIELTIGREV